MNSNLPQIRKEKIFTRIKKWLKNILGISEIIEESIHEVIDQEKNNLAEIEKNDFREEIKVESKDVILALQRKINEKQMEISDLTDDQLDEIIKLYESQIKEKENKIRFYKERLLKN